MYATEIAGFEAVGDDIEDLIEQVSGFEAVGAVPAGSARRLAAVRSRAGAAQPTGPLVKTRPETGKRAPLGFGGYSLTAGSSTTLTARVQRPFHPDRLLVTSSQLGVLITSIRVGDEEQVLNGSIPAELYGVNALADSKPDDFTPSQGGIDFSIGLTNGAATTSTGAAGMKGYVKR